MKIKKMIAVLSALCLMGALVPISENYLPEHSVIVAHAETYEQLTYQITTENTISISRCDTSATEIVVPAEIDGLPVTNIGLSSFSNCTKLTSVVIPDSVTRIQAAAFLDCSSLVSVTIPESVTNFEGNVFSGTPWLEAKREENPLVIINGILIDGATCTGDIIIPDGVTSIVPSVFFNRKDLTSVTLPDSLITIEDDVFSGSGLTSIIIPDSVTSIGDGAFYNCSSLSSVVISENVTNISTMTFSGCSSLGAVTIKNRDCALPSVPVRIVLGIPDTVVIYGYTGSTAQTFAEKNNFKFIPLDGESETLQSGDPNGDGEIDIRDVILINKAIFGKVSLTEEQRKAVDFNHNGMPDAEDALILMKYIVKLIDTLP